MENIELPECKIMFYVEIYIKHEMARRSGAAFRINHSYYARVFTNPIGVHRSIVHLYIQDTPTGVIEVSYSYQWRQFDPRK